MINTQIEIKNWRRIYSFSACFLLALAVSVSCKKTPAKFGTDALSPESILNSGGSDDYPLITYTVEEDSFPTDNQLHALLGVMHDPKMGITNASFYTQFTYNSSVTHAAGQVPVIDSVVLSLHYQGYYGQSTTQTFEVHQLTDDLDIDETYYKDSETFESLTNLVESGAGTITPNPESEDSVILADGTEMEPHLRLRLENSLGFSLMNEAINGTAFDSEDAFKTWFKGLHIKSTSNPGPGQGGILYFDLENADTKLTVYYKIQGDVTATPYNYGLVIKNSCADYNHVEVDNTGYDVEGTFDNPTNGNVQFYAQAFESRGVVKFPTVNDIEPNSLVQAAVLELPIAYQTGNLYYPSTVLTVIIETDDYVATTYAIYDDANHRYLVDLRSYVQSIVSGESDNTGIIINPLYPTGTAERIVFNGKGTSYKSKPRLIIKYTKF